MIEKRYKDDKETIDIETYLHQKKCAYCKKIINVVVNGKIFIRTDGETGAYETQDMQFCSHECIDACQCSYEG